MRYYLIDPKGFSNPLRSVIKEINRTGRVYMWSIQRLEAWREFEKSGKFYFKADGRRIISEFRHAYQWLRQQMKKRIFSSPRAYPIWAWVYPRPDLRGGAHLPKGTRGVRFKFHLPFIDTLLLDFSAWHCVLNKDYLSLTEKEDDEWLQRLPNPHAHYDDLSASLREEVENSWDQVFDLNALNKSKWVGPVRYIQAVAEKIPRICISEVKVFTQR